MPGAHRPAEVPGPADCYVVGPDEFNSAGSGSPEIHTDRLGHIRISHDFHAPVEGPNSVRLPKVPAMSATSKVASGLAAAMANPTLFMILVVVFWILYFVMRGFPIAIYALLTLFALASVGTISLIASLL